VECGARWGEFSLKQVVQSLSLCRYEFGTPSGSRDHCRVTNHPQWQGLGRGQGTLDTSLRFLLHGAVRDGEGGCVRLTTRLIRRGFAAEIASLNGKSSTCTTVVQMNYNGKCADPTQTRYPGDKSLRTTKCDDARATRA
jgi:hypothetical protein